MALPTLTAVGELEGEDAALVQVQLVLVGLGVVQHFHIAALHAHCQPLARGAVPQREDLRAQNRLAPLSTCGLTASQALTPGFNSGRAQLGRGEEVSIHC